jgi:hypothetical protein
MYDVKPDHRTGMENCASRKRKITAEEQRQSALPMPP